MSDATGTENSRPFASPCNGHRRPAMVDGKNVQGLTVAATYERTMLANSLL